jgi:hypothetical protein
MAVTAPSPTREGWGPEWDDLQDDVERAQGTLAAADGVPDEVRAVIVRLGARLAGLSSVELGGLDPYLVLALQGGAIQALRALELGDVDRRREARTGLERVRQALRDLADDGALSDDRPAKLVVRWLVETLDAPHPRIAELLRTSPRTLQRWLSDEATQPRGDDAGRVRLVAKVADQLRHALTGEGVLRWFETPNVDLRGAKPSDLLSDPAQALRLLRLASSTRVSVAT